MITENLIAYKDAILVFSPVKYGMMHNWIFFILAPIIIFSFLQIMHRLISRDKISLHKLIDLSLVLITAGTINVLFISLITFDHITYGHLQSFMAIVIFYLSAFFIFGLSFSAFQLFYKIIISCRPKWRKDHTWIDNAGVLISSLFSLWITNSVIVENHKFVDDYQLFWFSGLINPIFITCLRIIFIVFTTHVLTRAFSSVVVNNLKSRIGNRGIAGNVMSILQNIFTTLVIVVALFFILREFYVNIAPIVTGLGIVGIGLGWILQQPLQDLAGCVFIILEDAVHLGDIIELPGGIVGKIEQLTLRTIKIRSLKGELHIIPYHKLEIITNHTADTGYAMLDIPVAYQTNIQSAIDGIRSVVNEIMSDGEYQNKILGPMEMFGVNSLADSAIIIRFRIPTNPHDKWAISRELNRRIKEKFDEMGIRIPFPQRELHIIQEEKKLLPSGAQPEKKSRKANLNKL